MLVKRNGSLNEAKVRSVPPVPATLSKQESAYRSIRARIEEGQYTPGQRLIIDQLADELGVSAVPVREAIRRLEAEGWLRYELNTGATVAPLSREVWAQLTESVAVMEGYATALAAPHVTGGDLTELTAINRRMRQALRQLDLQAVSDCNRAFHRLMLARCPNKIIIEQLRHFQARLDCVSRALFSREQGVLLRLLGPQMGQRALADHQAIIAALRGKAGGLAIEQLTREHVLVHLRAAQEDHDRSADGRHLAGR
jgi:DNA-binding GntR family transcriptional regulator